MTIPQYLLVSITSGLTVAFVIWFAGKRRLYVVVPKLFSHSNLADNANTVELSVINRGYKSEENVRIELDPTLNYESIASTNPSIFLKKSSLEIERIPGNDETNIIILAEGGDFTKKSIASISSKECKGKVVEKLDDVFPAFGAIISGIFGFFLIAGIFFGAGYITSEVLRLNLLAPEILHPIEIPEELDRLGWKNIDDFVRSSLYDEAQPSRFPIVLTEVKRVRSTVITTVTINNFGSEVLRVNGELISPVEDKKDVVPFDFKYFRNVVVFPNQVVTKTLKAYLPAKNKQQILFANFDLQYGNEIIYNLEKELNL